VWLQCLALHSLNGQCGVPVKSPLKHRRNGTQRASSDRPSALFLLPAPTVM
jgi:hypothetical protein